MREIQRSYELLRKLLPGNRPCPGMRYIPSRFTLSLKYEGRSYVYNTLTGELLETELPGCTNAGCGYDELIERYFLVPENKDENAFYMDIANLIRAYEKKRRNKNYVILPTLKCNARCVYCYQEGMAQTVMTPEIVDQTIRYILKTYGGRKVCLAWFGGEPLLRPDIIDRICQAMKEAGVSYYSTMTSNGSLITEEILRKMTGEWNMKKIQLSMDGAEADYVARKQYPVYKDYFHGVLEAADRMAEKGIRVQIRCNVDEENWDGVLSFIKECRALVRHRDRAEVYFAPLNAVRQGERDVQMWEKIHSLDGKASGPSIQGQEVLDPGTRFRAFRCMADAGNEVIAPDGTLYACEHCPPEARFGNIFDGVTDEEARKAFCRTDRIREKCRTCPYLPLCTSFAACPVEDTHCRQVWEIRTMAGIMEKVKTHESKRKCN